RRPVPMAGYLGGLQEPTLLPRPLKLRGIQVNVLLGMRVVLARLPRRYGWTHFERDRQLLEQSVDHRALAASAWTRQYNELAACAHSTFCVISRMRSIDPLISTVCWLISTPLALEPIVFASRNIS